MKKLSILLFLLALSMGAMTQTAVNWVELYGVQDDGGGTIKSMGPLREWGNSVARTQDYLDTNENGYFEFIVQSTSVTKVIGFIKDGESFPFVSPQKIDYGFDQIRTSGNPLHAWESADSGQISTYAINDTLRVERLNDTVIYYKNSAVLRKVEVSITNRWYIAASFYNWLAGEQFAGVKSNLTKKRVHFEKSKTDIVAPSIYGEIDITPSGGVAPYTYSWSNSDTVQDIDSLSVGKYWVTVTDDSGEVAVDTIWIFEKVKPKWEELYGTKLDTATKVRSTGAVESWSNSQARTANYLEPGEDGEFHYTVKDNVCVKMLGFIKDGDHGAPVATSDIVHGLYQYFSSEKLLCREGASNQQIHIYLVVGDVLKLKRTGNTVSYYVNDQLMKTTSISTPTKRWYLQAIFFNKYTGEFYEDVEVSFTKQAVHASYTTTDITELKGKGSIDLTVAGGAPPYDYIWSTGDTLQDVDSLDAGLYHVSIVDTINDTITYAIPIWEKEDASWDTIVGVSITGADNDTVTSTSVTQDYTTAQSQTIQYLELADDGEFIYTELNPTENKVLGFVEDTTTTPTGDYNWAAAFYLKSDGTYIGSNGVAWEKVSVDTPVVGDVFKITRYDSTVTFLKNGVVQKKLTIHPYGKWYLQVGFLNNQANSKIYDVPVSFVNQTGKFFKKKTYAPLRKKLDGGHFLVEDGKLRFQYDEQYVDQDNDLTYNIYNDYNELVVAATAVALDPAYGDNRFEVDLSCGGIGLNSGFYTLEVINEKNEFLYLRFRNEKNYTCNEGPGVTISPN